MKRASSGFSMIEVLVTIIILAVGLLGLAGLQAKTQSTEMESYQRVQALIILNDIANRMTANIGQASDYFGNVTPSASLDCTSAAYTTEAERDSCAWSNALYGASEKNDKGAYVGAMIGARGCIAQIQAPVLTNGACAPGIYEITIAWQGLVETAAPPANACGQNQFGNERLRRVISVRVGSATTGCI